MADDDAGTSATEGQDGTATEPSPEAPHTADVAELEAAKAEAAKWRELSQKNERQSKANLKELERLRTASMTDQEKVVAEAEARGRAAALAEAGKALVAAEVRAACAPRSLDADALLDGLDRSRFLDDNGDPDRKAIEAYLDRLVPKDRQQLDLGQGARPLNDGAGSDMNRLIRQAAGRQA